MCEVAHITTGLFAVARVATVSKYYFCMKFAKIPNDQRFRFPWNEQGIADSLSGEESRVVT